MRDKKKTVVDRGRKKKKKAARSDGLEDVPGVSSSVRVSMRQCLIPFKKMLSYRGDVLIRWQSGALS